MILQRNDAMKLRSDILTVAYNMAGLHHVQSMNMSIESRDPSGENALKMFIVINQAKSRIDFSARAQFSSSHHRSSR